VGADPVGADPVSPDPDPVSWLATTSGQTGPAVALPNAAHADARSSDLDAAHVGTTEGPPRVAPAAGARRAAEELFGPRVEQALRYAGLLADTGIQHGLIGPREGDRVWERHVLNCAVIAELLEEGARVLDLGSGAGLPGIPLALARPDLEIVLLEPLQRRSDWLRDTARALELNVTVVRGRAEERQVRRDWSGADVVTARAVAPLARLAGWAMPLLRTDGRLLAIKGASAVTEAARDRAAVRGFGGSAPRVVQCGGAHVDPPTTVVVVERTATRSGARVPGRANRRSG
jgi:16S rRNA (guanine527-N7)-methyltransferase